MNRTEFREGLLGISKLIQAKRIYKLNGAARLERTSPWVWLEHLKKKKK
jgi:hypothetical protein